MKKKSLSNRLLSLPAPCQNVGCLWVAPDPDPQAGDVSLRHKHWGLHHLDDGRVGVDRRDRVLVVVHLHRNVRTGVEVVPPDHAGVLRRLETGAAAPVVAALLLAAAVAVRGALLLAARVASAHLQAENTIRLHFL